MKSDSFIGNILNRIKKYTGIALEYIKTAHGGIKQSLPELRQRLWERTYRFTRCAAYGMGVFIRKRAARSAAQFSFFILMTLFPLLICIHWFLGMLNENFSKIIDTVTGLMPASVVNIFSDYIDYISANSSKTILIAGLIMLITPSAAAFRALRGILCDIRDMDETNGTLMFVLSFFVSVIMLIIIYASMILLLTGNRLLRFLVERFHLSSSLLGWNWIRFLLLFVMLFLMLYIMYRFAHIDPLNPREVLTGKVYPGALAASAVTVGVSIIYSWFLSLSTRYSLVYGSLASLIILMMWLYTCSNIIIMGGVFNLIMNERDVLLRKIKVPKDVHTAAGNARRALRTAMRGGIGRPHNDGDEEL